MTERSGNQGLATGMAAEVHLCAVGGQTRYPNFLQPSLPHAWYHPGSQEKSPETSHRMVGKQRNPKS